MKRIITCFFFLIVGLNTYSQVKSIMLDVKDRITTDSTLAVTYAVFGKLTGDTVYTFKKFDFEGILLASGSFKDDSLKVPHGKFIYYEWITPANNNTNYGYDIKGKERFVSITGAFIDGLQSGRWISFYPEGTMKQVITFYKGVVHGGFQAFDLKGKILTSGLYISGKKNGPWMLDGGRQENTYVRDELVSSLRGKKLREKQAEAEKTN